ncbi:hypothetical protein [Adhaeribacter aquaticus]|uniref:hypothetical protein n=1 Tax=Adhaeribacter aquaticus TaxID=299567 RepID=UPI0003FC2062|nr:hypothetical protein [Adhaeribacter aquaticus]
MRIILKLSLVVLTGGWLLACSSDKKPDAVVVKNNHDQDVVEVMDSKDSTQYAGGMDAGPGSQQINNSDFYADTTDSLNDYEERASGKEQAVAKANKPAGGVINSNKPAKNKVKTKASVQQVLIKDARLAKVMPLSRFGRYMARRWNYYKGFGEVSYKDATVKIKITDEELKIETPEGKFKQEKDEIKLKTDAGKYKKEIRS